MAQSEGLLPSGDTQGPLNSFPDPFSIEKLKSPNSLSGCSASKSCKECLRVHVGGPVPSLIFRHAGMALVSRTEGLPSSGSYPGCKGSFFCETSSLGTSATQSARLNKPALHPAVLMSVTSAKRHTALLLLVRTCFLPQDALVEATLHRALSPVQLSPDKLQPSSSPCPVSLK